jgi:hypothetical protein
MKSLCSALPSGQQKIGIAQCADPDVATRIFKDSEDFIARQPIAGCIGGLRARSGNVLKPLQPGVTHKPLTGAHPPFPATILKHNLIPAPAPVGQAFWQSNSRRSKATAIEAVQMCIGGYNHEPAILVVECHGDFDPAKTIRQTVSGESVYSQSHGPTVNTAHP